MAPSVRPVEDPMLRLQYYKETGQTGEAQHYEQYLRETGQWKEPAPARAPYDIHAEYRSGQLAKRMQGANEADQADAEGPGYFARLATHLLNAGQGMPGMELIQAGAGVAGSHLPGNRPISYPESLAALRGNTDEIGTGTKIAEHMMGSLPLLPFLPASPIKAGALLGASGALLSADPVSTPEDMLMREAKTVGMGVAGGLLGHFGDKAITAARASAVGTPAAEMFEKQAARTASAKRLYDAALAEGRGKPFTPALKAFIAEPEMADLVTELQNTSHKGVAAESPEMLDALYKVLSDRAGAAQKGLEALNPAKPNIGRFRLQDIRGTQDRLLDAMNAPGEQTITTETAQSPHPSLMDAIDALRNNKGIAWARQQGTVMQKIAREALERRSAESAVSPSITGSRTQVVETPPLMPTYKTAVADFAKRTGEMKALGRGSDQLMEATAGKLVGSKQLMKKTPEAFAEWAKTATPSEIAAAKEGILAQTHAAFGLPGKTFAPGRYALGKAGGLLQLADPNDGGILAAKLGLLGINSAR